MTVEFGREIEPQSHARVLGFVKILDSLAGTGSPAGVVEWAPAFRSVTVYFDHNHADFESLAELLLVLARKRTTASASGLRWRIPAFFEPEFAPDLKECARDKQLDPADIMALMTQAVYTFHMIGFLPGFPYLGGLPPALEMRRLATPRTGVPAGSIAITGSMCAIYPWNGWRLVGRTPVQLFDVSNGLRPALFSAGDEIQWRSIDRAAYADIDAQFRGNAFDISTLLCNGPAA